MVTENKGKFADIAQQIAIGTPISSIKAPGVNVELFASGLKITRDNQELIIDTGSGVLSSDGKTSLLRTTNSAGEFSSFKRQSQGAFAFGQSFEVDDLAINVTNSKLLVRYGLGLGNAVLVTNLDSDTRGVALYTDKDRLSAGEIKVVGASPAPAVVLDRDLSALTPSSI